MDSLFGENFMNRILAFSEMVSSYNPLHEFLLGDDHDKSGDIGNKLQETLDEEENVNVEVNEEEEVKDEFVDKESVKVKNEKDDEKDVECEDEICLCVHDCQVRPCEWSLCIGMSKHDAAAAILSVLSRQNMSLSYMPETQEVVQSYGESGNLVTYYFEQCIKELLPFNRIYTESGAEVTVIELAELSRLEMMASKHDCEADTDLGDILLDSLHNEDFAKDQQFSSTSPHNTGYICGKDIYVRNSDMSSSLTLKPDCYSLSLCQDQMLAATQFMVDSINTNSTVPSVASFYEDLALFEQHAPAELGNHGIELSTVDTEPVNHDDCRSYEGEEFVSAATHMEVRRSEVDTHKFQDDVKTDYKKVAEAALLQSAPSLCADYSRDLGESVPVSKLGQAATFPWPHDDDDDDAGGPRAGPLQPVPGLDGTPDGPLHALLGLPELEDSLGNTDTLDQSDHGISAPLDEMQELDDSYATETKDKFNEERSNPGMDINHPCFSWIFAKAEDKQEDSTTGSSAGYFTESLSDESNSIVGSPLPKHDQQHVKLLASQSMAQTSLPIAGSMSPSNTEMSADLSVVGDKLGPEENQINTGQDRPFYTMYEVGHAIEAEADVENKLPLIEHQPAYTEMSVAEYKQSQTVIGPMPVADIDLTSAIPLYERRYKESDTRMSHGYNSLLNIVGPDTVSKADTKVDLELRIAQVSFRSVLLPPALLLPRTDAAFTGLSQ